MKTLLMLLSLAAVANIQAEDKDIVRRKYEPKLDAARKSYDKEILSIQKSMYKAYISLRDRAMRDKKLDKANKWQKEADAIKDANVDMPSSNSSPQGKWVITYTNKAVRQYEFVVGNKVRMQTGGHVGSVKSEKAGWLIKYDEVNNLEVWKEVSSKEYVVHHYNPISTYPDGKPTVYGVAMKVE